MSRSIRLIRQQSEPSYHKSTRHLAPDVFLLIRLLINRRFTGQLTLNFNLGGVGDALENEKLTSLPDQPIDSD